jgi:hypothetical protein
MGPFGERSDYAWVDIEPPLQPQQTGISMPLTRVIVAPRHQGTYLDQEPGDWPIYVYFLTTPEDLLDSDIVLAAAVQIRAWGLLTGRL